MKTSFPRPSLHFPNYIRVIADKIQLTSVLLKTIWCLHRIIHKIFVTWFLLQKTSFTGTWKNTDLSYSSDHWVHDYLAYNLSDVENRALFIVLSYACNLLNLIIEIIQYCFSFFVILLLYHVSIIVRPLCPLKIGISAMKSIWRRKTMMSKMWHLTERF